jgi:hypothetical protein
MVYVDCVVVVVVVVGNNETTFVDCHPIYTNIPS